MRKFIVLLFACIAFLSNAKVLSLYYGPDRKGKYHEIVIHGENALTWEPSDTIPSHSRARIRWYLKNPNMWRNKFVRFDKSEDAFVFEHNPYDPPRYEPPTMRLYISRDLSKVVFEYMIPDADLPNDTLSLVKSKLYHREGEADYIGKPEFNLQLGKQNNTSP